MDKETAIIKAKKYAKSVCEKYDVKKILLFGSFAKGNYNKDSDIDLAIIVKTTDDIIDLQIELMQMRTDDELIIEPHPIYLSDFNYSNLLATEVKKYGIEIY